MLYIRIEQLVFYFLLMLSAALTLIGKPYFITAVRDERLPAFWVLVGPALFASFLITFIIFELIRLRRKPQSQLIALAPLLFGIPLIILSLPDSLNEFQTRRVGFVGAPAALAQLSHSRNALIRALVVLALPCALGPLSDAWIKHVQQGLEDGDPMVQDAAKHVLSMKLGIPFPAGVAGVEYAKKALENLKAVPFDEE